MGLSLIVDSKSQGFRKDKVLCSHWMLKNFVLDLG